MLFSIIVPIYKTEEYLLQCVDSILSQKFGDFEVILVDDGSPDNCPAMIDEIARKDSRVVAVHKPNGGLVSARKAGMTVARGDYIVNIDSDDFISPDFLSEIAEKISESSSDAVFFGYTLYVKTPTGETKQKRLNTAPIGVYRDDKKDLLLSSYLYDCEKPEMNGGCVLFNICCKAIKRDLYIAAQNAVPNAIVSGEDTLFTMNLLPNISSVHIADICGYYYRQNPKSIEHTVSKIDFSNLSAVFDEMVKIFEKTESYKNPSYVYVLSRIWTLTIRNAKSAHTFGEFKRILGDPVYKKLCEYSKKAVVNHPKTTEKVLIFALKHKLYLFIYILGKTWFKNKDF